MNEVTVRIAGRNYVVSADNTNIRVNGELVNLRNIRRDGTKIYYESELQDSIVLDLQNGESFLHWRGRELPLEIETNRDRLIRESSRGTTGGQRQSVVKAMMPGLVVKLHAISGMIVKKGTPLLILEAMKMENEIRSPVEGTVVDVRTSERESVEKNDILVVIE